MSKFARGLISALAALMACGPAREATPSLNERRAEARVPMHCSGSATGFIDGTPRRVRIEVTPCRVVGGRPPEAVLVNVGEARLGYGPGFMLERKTDVGWEPVNRRQAFPAPLFVLEPGEESEPESLAVYLNAPEPLMLEPGLYRVTKGLQLTPGKPRPPVMAVTARFRVIG